MRILIADKFSEPHIDAMRAKGHEVVSSPDTGADDLPDVIGGYDVLVVRSTQVTEDTLAAADSLALVIRAGAGVNTIDWRAAADRGIYVCNTPGQNATAVAELTIGLIASLDRRIPDAVADLRAGRWRKKEYSKARGLAGCTLGIIGFGDIGAAVAKRALALEMEVLVEAKPTRPAQKSQLLDELGCRLVQDRETLLASSDIVTLHVPVTSETEGMVSAEFLSHLRPGAFLVNTSRGDLIDEEALLRALDEKGLRVGLDVFAEEPGESEAHFDSALARHPNVYATHHIGASTDQSQAAIADAVVAIVDDFERGVVRDCVNLQEHPSGTVVVAVRHHNRVGVLARILGVLRNAGLNVEHMQNRVFDGGVAASATIHVSGDVDAGTVALLVADEDVIGVSVEGR